MPDQSRLGLCRIAPQLARGAKSFRELVGLAINICKAAVGAVPYTLVLPISCQQCKASSGY